MNTIKPIDIFGNTHLDDDNNKYNDNNIQSKPTFPKIDLNTGLNSTQLQSDSILIHRILQKKLSYNLDKNIHKFIKILINELRCKTSNYDLNIITRDTLLEYFVKNNKY